MVDNNNGENVSDYNGDHGQPENPSQLLPIANVGRIMKQILPPKAKISKEAKQTMQECVSEFISFVTAEASDKCRKERRKTVNGDDICAAFVTLGFDDYGALLRRYLHMFRDQVEAEHSRANNITGDKNNMNMLSQLSADQEQRIIMIMSQYVHPNHDDIEKT